MKQGVTMSQKEIDRVAVMEKLIRKELKHSQASKILGISPRQSKRLKKLYKECGAVGLVHQARGQISNRRIPDSVIKPVIEIVKKDYADFGPSFAHEKLMERGCISFSAERLRQAMIVAELWKPKKRKRDRNHPSRDRRPCLGELVQIDGSPHKWFEDRGPRCTLIAYIDDATSKLLHLRFVESESTWAYFGSTERYLNEHGKPLAFYSDKHGVFRVNASKEGSAYASDSHGDTQFGRAMRELGITVIHAHCPQAKGRVERVFETLQDRLVKEMRLRGISTIEEGNDYLPTYLEAHNAKFAVEPQEPVNMHQPLRKQDDLKLIFTKQGERTLSKTLSCQYENKLYQIQTKQSAYIMRYIKVTVQESQNGTVQLIYKGKPLDYKIIKKQPKTIDADSKQINHTVDNIKRKRKSHKPATNHPWRSPLIESTQIKERSLVYQK